MLCFQSQIFPLLYASLFNTLYFLSVLYYTYLNIVELELLKYADTDHGWQNDGSDAINHRCSLNNHVCPLISIFTFQCYNHSPPSIIIHFLQTDQI